MRKQFTCPNGRDMYFSFKCTCPSDLFKNTDIAHLMETTITLSGYADDYFFNEVNREPRTFKCKCNKIYKYQWFRDGVECEEIKDAEVIK
jgi:hypothetical protein